MLEMTETVSGCPCRGCEKRKLFCHSTCKDYLDWQKKQREFTKQVRRMRKG